MKRVLLLLLCIAMLPIIMVSCNNSSAHTEGISDTLPAATERNTERITERPRDPNRLAKVNVITGDSEAEIFAGSELKKYLKKKFKIFLNEMNMKTQL